LEYFDFILCVDSEVRDKVLQMAALRAGGSDRVADPDIFSASPFISSSSTTTSSSSLTDRLSYEEYERKIILAGSHSAPLVELDVSETVEIPKLPDIKLLHPAVLAHHMPLVMPQVLLLTKLSQCLFKPLTKLTNCRWCCNRDKACYSTLEFLAHYY
jgi:hypothetical protein